MPSQTFYPSVSTGSGASLTIAYDHVAHDGVNAWVVNPRVQWEQRGGWSDSTNYADQGGSGLVPSRLFTNRTLNASQTWGLTARGVAMQYGTTTRVELSVTLANVSFFTGDGSTRTYTMLVDLPRRPYGAPGAATNLVAAPNAAGYVSLTWALPDEPAHAPVQAIHVYRRTDYDTNEVELVANLGRVTSWEDTGTAFNHRYRYLLVCLNADNRSPDTPLSPWAWMAPAAPTQVTAAKNPNGSISVSFVDNAIEGKGDRGVHIDWSTDQGLTSAQGVIDIVPDSDANPQVWVHQTPDPAKTHAYRVRVATPGDQYSAWSVWSAAVQLQAPPNAPTVTGPPAAFDATDAQVITWKHNPVDSTTQQAATVRWREVGAGVWNTASVTGSASTYAVPTGALTNGKRYEFQVQTRGADPNFGPWSASSVSDTTAKPVANITSPAPGNIPTDRAVLTWSYYDAEGAPQSRWEATLTGPGGAAVSSGGGFGQTNQWAPIYDLADGATYTWTVVVYDGVGLASAPASVTRTVVYVKPLAPAVTVETQDAAGSATIIPVASPDVPGTPDTVAVGVVRLNPDGTETVLSVGMTSGTAVTDSEAPYGARYAAVAYAESGAAQRSAPSAPVQFGCWGYLSGGGRVARGRWNLEAPRADSWDREVVPMQGRPFGVGMGTPQRAASIDVRVELDAESSSHTDFLSVVDGSLVCLWRDPVGGYVRGVVTNLRRIPTASDESLVSFTIQRVATP